jgi:Domain of unknown function (DUF397)
MEWVKSSYSFANGNCVEAAGNWRTSSHSAYNGNCAEVASLAAGTVAVRDTNDRGGPVLTFSAATWEQFTAKVKRRAAPSPGRRAWGDPAGPA